MHSLSDVYDKRHNVQYSICIIPNQINNTVAQTLVITYDIKMLKLEIYAIS
jgi:hypothetical protein